MKKVKVHPTLASFSSNAAMRTQVLH